MTQATTSTPFPRLLADVGGTNARYAWQTEANAALTEVAVYPCNQHLSFEESLAHYLQEHSKPLPRAAGIGIATQIMSDQVQMTNHHWAFSMASLKKRFALERLVVINDFTALSLSLPSLTHKDLVKIGPGSAVLGAPLAVIGPGTGLGVSGLLPTFPGGYVPISGEGGHVSLAADNPREVAVIAAIQRRYGHASAERVLSGPGLVNLYLALKAIDGHPPLQLSPAEIMARAKSAEDPSCAETLNLFFGFLGSVAGNLALTLGARGGLYVGGGVVPRALEEFNKSQFRARFVQKGRYRDYLESIPTWVIHTNDSPALLGAARALDLTHT